MQFIAILNKIGSKGSIPLKELDMRISIKRKALGAFRNLGAVVLITATLAMCFIACNQTGGGGNAGGGGGTPTPTPKPKHAITFSVEGANGTLKVIVSDKEINSGDEVEEGKTVNFVAMPDSGYRVKEWKLDDTVVTGKTSIIYTHTVTKACTVKVSFEPIPKYTVTLIQQEHGKVTASPEIPVDKQVAEGTEITFTATANTGYKIGKWTVTPAEALQAGTGADGSPTAKVKITADTTIKVSFEVTSVEGGAVLILSQGKFDIGVRAVTADGSAIQVKGCIETTLESDKNIQLNVTDTTVILKGKIIELKCSNNKLIVLNVQGLKDLQELNCSSNKLTELNVQGLTSLKKLYCGENQLTELNVQGLTALKELYCSYTKKLTALNVQGCTALQALKCYGNQLNAQAMTEILKALPAREASDNAEAGLYTEQTGVTEGNCKDFTQPVELKKAVEGAKKRNWKLKKINASGQGLVDI